MTGISLRVMQEPEDSDARKLLAEVTRLRGWLMWIFAKIRVHREFPVPPPGILEDTPPETIYRCGVSVGYDMADAEIQDALAGDPQPEWEDADAVREGA